MSVYLLITYKLGYMGSYIADSLGIITLKQLDS